VEAALPAGARIATVSGRYYAMDRDNRWERVSRAYLAMAEAEAPHVARATEAVQAAYGAGKFDEFIEPAVVGDYAGMKDGDGILCFNFRADRAREIMAALLDPGFTGFERPRAVGFAGAAGMTRYSDALAPLMGALFAPQTMDRLLGQVVAAAGLRQVRLAETEKYPHVTYFFNGGVETPNAGEDRVMIPSPKVATYDLQPEMSAPELTEAAVKAIGSGDYAMLILNFANPDMVGHTGSLPAAIRAVETVDAGLGRIMAAIEAQRGWLLVAADHGNCELMRDPATGGPHTAHTTNVVPVLLFGPTNRALAAGRLADVAPTMLELLGLAVPPEMTGRSLLAGA
jgi:2,3-bisphosphoglycerate-independent phosphoglycerate mutase